MRIDIRKQLMDLFTQRNDVVTEMKTSIISSDEHYVMAMLYAIAETSKTTKMIVEPWLRGLASSSRGLGGKGSEQLISLLYPGRIQQYLFPYPIFQQQQLEVPQQNQEQEQSEKTKRRLIPFL